ncbi:Hypothetical predicted protein [Octopus vulgaris]|uniref:Uncharacterized protein n=1 Tax=Octopus vulgaris TaxID=6645 RepID=A0AA36B804_OCTVU|nr:Hypothetical predicted protein [Octopus vulgaris]
MQENVNSCRFSRNVREALGSRIMILANNIPAGIQKDSIAFNRFECKRYRMKPGTKINAYDICAWNRRKNLYTGVICP